MAHFSDYMIDAVWQNAKTEEGYDSNIWRKDFADAWIRRDHYGVESKYGWEVDHLRPSSKGGSDELSNLTALHWKNNRKKSDDYPQFQTIVSSEGNTNIEKLRSWRAK
mgnify:CR=1 FL=1